ncbi:MAG: esterase-like activity of phytase family protein [Sphingomonadaceae bacterium]
MTGRSRRPLRAWAALALLLFLGTFIWPEPVDPPPAESEPLPLTLAPLAAPPGASAGPLRYVEGWRLGSAHPHFGGISALHVEGGRVVALSDSGLLFEFPVPQGDSASGTLRPLPGRVHQGAHKTSRDTEALVVSRQAAWATFEVRNAVARFDPGLAELEARRRPRAMRGWPHNGGAEAMVRLADGRFLIFSERERGPEGALALLLFGDDPAAAASRATNLGYRPPPGYRPTDAALLPDGRLLVLNRRFSIFGGFSAALLLADLPPLRQGTVISGRVIAASGGAFPKGNFEALAVSEEKDGLTIWLATDDNFVARYQRTLLLRYAWEPP